MSPFKTFQICGSSSRDVFFRNRPGHVIPGIIPQLLGSLPFRRGCRMIEKVLLQARVGIPHHGSELQHRKDMPVPAKAELAIERVSAVAQDNSRRAAKDHGKCDRQQKV